ncbi:amidase domain-containing protein [Metabacillus niabensis]|uniref:Putative amidase domain-containing protein n=1 Tax=Metabacillus niabensis TaxID=324854 RepID=A0ABT9Z809_9BACI|nr:amidase domain-containing protein [Metabacillus niabensis]MDQ0228399.1 hypothetical protein [Metabacillus niabensis]
MKKNIYLLIFAVISFLFIGLGSVSAEEKARDDYTFGEIETMVVEYFKENNVSIEIGSEEYNNYIIEQMNTDADKNLANHKDYHLICAYFAEYLHRLSLEEAKAEAEIQGSFKTMQSQSDEFQLNNEVKETTLGEMKEEIQKEELAAELEKKSNFSTMATGTINVGNARKYAEKYYKNYNTAYPKYPLDCTNFVSQILLAGGKRLVGTSTTTLVKDTKAWFIMKRPDNTFSRSTSWTVVTDLYSHLVRTQGSYTNSTKSHIIKNAKSGDVIQFKKKGADRYSHSMWVYEKQNSNLLLSGHTDNYLKRSFNAITAYYEYRIVQM